MSKGVTDALNIDSISHIMYPENAFNYLVLPPGHKDILASLVSAHVSGRRTETGRFNVDINTGKGKASTSTTSTEGGGYLTVLILG